MNYCEMQFGGPLFGRRGVCDEPASVKINSHWYCERHADSITEAEQVFNRMYERE
jgi:hypothetical protein